MRWIATAAEARPLTQGALLWLFADDDPAALAAAAEAPALPADLADAAVARAAGGGPRLLRRRVLRALAARAWGVHPAEPAFTRDAAGAVRVGPPWPGFTSAGGRCGWSVVALSAQPVGVDVEAADALPPRELDAWLRREAWGKLSGAGLTAGPPPPGLRAHRRAAGPVVALAVAGTRGRGGLRRRPYDGPSTPR